MKKLLGILLTVAMLLTCVSAFAADVEPTGDIVVLFTSDVHCGVDKNFGYAGLVNYRNKLVADGDAVALVDNGDSIQGEPIGTLSKGEYIIELMNDVGYDVAIPGNHEFDYGMDTFLALTEKANFPYISSNFKKGDELVFDAYKILELAGKKVAFVGVTTPKTVTSSTPAYFQDENGNYIYNFCQDETGEALYAAVQSAVDAARAEGADYVVAMAHLGNEGECMPWTSSEVVNNTTGIDVLLDGHDHQAEQNTVKNKDGQDVLMAGCGTKMSAISQLRIAADGTMTTQVVKYDATLAAMYTKDSSISDSISAITSQFEDTLNEVVANSDVDLVIYDPANPDVRLIRTTETNLGDLCADAYRAMSGADIAFVNGGGIRVNLEKGEITLGEILSVHPFGNALCTVEATGQQILDALEMASRNVPNENGGFLQVSGLTYEIHTYIESSVTLDENGMFKSVDGEYRVKNVKVGEEDLDVTKTYTLASHNYMLKSGGDGLCMFTEDPIILDETMLDNQVLINYITDTLGGSVGAEYADPYGQGRIVAVAEAPAK